MNFFLFAAPFIMIAAAVLEVVIVAYILDAFDLFTVLVCAERYVVLADLSSVRA